MRKEITQFNRARKDFFKVQAKLDTKVQVEIEKCGVDIDKLQSLIGRLPRTYYGGRRRIYELIATLDEARLKVGRKS